MKAIYSHIAPHEDQYVVGLADTGDNNQEDQAAFIKVHFLLFLEYCFDFTNFREPDIVTNYFNCI